MSLLSKAKAAFVGLVLSVVAGTAQARADAAEKLAALPPAGVTGAQLLGMPVSEWTNWLMLVYVVLLIAWHVYSKWLASWRGKPT